MAVLDSGLCQPWTAAACSAWPVNLQPAQAAAMEAATDILWRLTKQRFGVCPLVLRPCRRDLAGDLPLAWLGGSWLPSWGGAPGWGWPYPAMIGGRWYNLGCGVCGDSCGCTVLQQVELPQPVASVDQVIIGGIVLSPSAYRVDDWRWLVRTDGGTFPICQDLAAPVTGVGSTDTWQISMQVGEAVPVLGQFAVDELAREIARACLGEACGLPSPMVREVRRQGVRLENYNLNDPAALFGFGLPNTYKFLKTYNPTASRVASITNIDGPPRARRVGT